MIRLVLVDDQDLVRAGLRLIFSAEDDLEVVGEAANGQAGVAAVRALHPDVVLMDVRMPVLDGIQATRELVGGADGADGERAGGGGPRVLALTTFEDDEVVWGVIEAGAAGFVLKDAPAGDLVSAVGITARGGVWFDPRVASRVLGTLRRRPDRAAPGRPVEPLSDRELEVLRLLGVRDRPAAIIHAYDAGIVVPRA